jgi:hypothetical protein
MQRTTIAASLIALALCGAAQANPTAPGDDIGRVAAGTGAGRVIDVTPATRYLNVTNGETVVIRQGDHSVTWEVGTPHNLNALPLSRIVPPESAGADVQVYIAPSQQYQNS